MSTLNQRLTRIRESFAAQAPEAARAIMSRATADLRASGILSRLAPVGSPLPAFELSDSTGARVRSSELLARGPLVVTVYRGVW